MASRENYQPPASGAVGGVVGGGSSSAGGGAGAGTRPSGAVAVAMHYLCAECGVKVGINKGEPIRCKECGHRILYKQRTRRLVTLLHSLCLCLCFSSSFSIYLLSTCSLLVFGLVWVAPGTVSAPYSVLRASLRVSTHTPYPKLYLLGEERKWVSDSW